MRRGGYGIGVGAAALGAAVIIGGAMQQNQGYSPQGYYPDQGTTPVKATTPTKLLPSIRIKARRMKTPARKSPKMAIPLAYCEQTYRSYDPASGTYLGYDGLRHPCP